MAPGASAGDVAHLETLDFRYWRMQPCTTRCRRRGWHLPAYACWKYLESL